MGAFDPLCDFRDYARLGPTRLLARFLHYQETPIPQAGAPRPLAGTPRLLPPRVQWPPVGVGTTDVAGPT